ncbi:hypothetical protein ACFV6E_22610 [Streptomyces sp. NPDC059785]|uniref:hypothetical protein n=1 Tax=Streptomyces sp. NPDC059785 TaxID=3346945 RepID=UPI0036492FCF
MTALLVANAIVSLGSVVFAVVGGMRPQALSDSGTPTGGERFHGWMYAVRGVPLGVAAGVVPFLGSSPACSLLLFAAAAAQAGDVAIGAVRRKSTMIAGASLLVVIHATTAVVMR